MLVVFGVFAVHFCRETVQREPVGQMISTLFAAVSAVLLATMILQPPSGPTLLAASLVAAIPLLLACPALGHIPTIFPWFEPDLLWLVNSPLWFAVAALFPCAGLQFVAAPGP